MVHDVTPSGRRHEGIASFFLKRAAIGECPNLQGMLLYRYLCLVSYTSSWFPLVIPDSLLGHFAMLGLCAGMFLCTCCLSLLLSTCSRFGH